MQKESSETHFTSEPIAENKIVLSEEEEKRLLLKQLNSAERRLIQVRQAKRRVEAAIEVDKLCKRGVEDLEREMGMNFKELAVLVDIAQELRADLGPELRAAIGLQEEDDATSLQ